MAQTALDLLAPKPGETALDCTLGRGGHTALLAEAVGPSGRVVAIDVDPANITFARQRFADSPCKVDIVQANFAESRRVLDELDIPGVDVLLADLGFASTQMDDPERGFSFQADGPLDMRLDPTLASTAADLVNTMPERDLADMIYEYGEERLSRRIASKIVESRRKCPIDTTSDLAQLVRAAYGPRGRNQRIDPATRTFMALRIAVNGELAVLDRLLDVMPSLVAVGGRASIISFHSLEDRRVKQRFAGWHREGMVQRLTKKPALANDREIRDNPRSRSAKLRAIRMIDAAQRDSG